MAVEMPVVAGHPNRVAFEGVLTFVDVASDRAPSGAKGHRVLLTRQAAIDALPSLMGMAVNYGARWDGHDAQRKCGIITEADVQGVRLTVAGYLFGKDFPEVGKRMEGIHAAGDAGEMGMSYELADAHVEDMRAQVWRLSKVTFTGAAILLRSKAAYAQTSFRLTAASTRSAAPVPARMPASMLMSVAGAAGPTTINCNTNRETITWKMNS